MSYYGDDRVPAYARPTRTVEVSYPFHRPVTRRAGHKARVTIETGAANDRLGEDAEIDILTRRENREANFLRSRARGREHTERTPVYYENIPRPSRTKLGSPAGRPSVPISELAPDNEDVDEVLSPIEDSDEYAEKVDFKIPKTEGAVHFSEDVSFLVPGSGSNDSQAKPSPSLKPTFTGQMTELNIRSSHWIGNTFERGELSAELSTMPVKSEQSERQTMPLMRWYHLHRHLMNFEEYVAASQSVLQLPDKELRDVVKLLRDVQKKFEKQRHNGREMEPACVSDVFYNDATGNSRQTGSVVFLSFPYFCLESYDPAPIKSLTPASPMHPVRPLLEAYYYSSTQKRELAQAITSLPSTPDGQCLHVSQVWCLVVNGTTMITCSRLSSDALCGETIKQAVSSISDDSARIKVSLGTDRSWNVPVTSEMSWPSFLSLFGEKVAGMEAQGASAKFEYNMQTIDSKLWHELVEAAKSSTVELTMRDVQFHVQEADEQMVEDNPEPDEGDDIVAGAGKEDISSRQSIAEQARDSPGPPQAIKRIASMRSEPTAALQIFKHTGNASDMHSLANSLHKILLSNPRTTENTGYRQCPRAKVDAISSWLSADLRPAERSIRSRGSLLLRKQKRRVALLVKYLFHLFWPIDFEHVMIDKFWGALSKILNREDEFFVEVRNQCSNQTELLAPERLVLTCLQGHNNPRSDVSAAIDMYNVLHDRILPLAAMLTQEFYGYESDLRPLPEAFSKAWLHLITAITLAAEQSIVKNSSFHESMASRHLRAILEELENGKVDITVRLRSMDLDDLEICTENSILSLLLNRIARDVMPGLPDVATSYTNYFQSLEFNVTDNPAPRYHQENLRFFLQEVEAVLATLQSQQSVVELFQQSLEQQRIVDDAILIYNLGVSRQSVVIEDCKSRLDGRIDKFKGLQRRAEDLGEWHRNQIDTHKDRQENAIMVFTIVTITFLPLSFVSSVFGMNTHDIRNMTYNQWTYWATAIPLSLVVVFSSLYWAGELRSLGRWLARAVPQSKSSRGYRQQEPGLLDPIRSSQADGMGQKGYAKDSEQLPPPPRRRTTYPRGEA